jgi:hypothetical protein
VKHEPKAELDDQAFIAAFARLLPPVGGSKAWRSALTGGLTVPWRVHRVGGSGVSHPAELFEGALPGLVSITAESKSPAGSS